MLRVGKKHQGDQCAWAQWMKEGRVPGRRGSRGLDHVQGMVRTLGFILREPHWGDVSRGVTRSDLTF